MNKIEIGNDCLFGPNVVIVDHDHDYHFTDNQRGNHWLLGEVKIGNNVWVGANVTILRGTTIGDGVIIGAGAVVKGKVEANTILYQKSNYIIKAITENDKREDDNERN